MADQPALRFSGLLRQLRAEARLTQEELAEAAGLSPRSVSDLERGVNRTARKDTALLLADALSLGEAARPTFVAAARGKVPAADVLAARQVLSNEPRSRLPVLADSFVGRSRELSEIRALLVKHRLVTLTGPGGCGKTRLAIEVAGRLAASCETGKVFYVDAAPLTDAAFLPDRLAQVMGILPATGESSADALARVAGNHAVVALLDNLEHLPDAASVVTSLLRAGPGMRLLATSRAPLRARGEHLYLLLPLAVPAANAAAGSAARSAAVELFADRSAAVDPRFELSAEIVPAVAEICRRLDGLPLAIELAASRARVLPPAALLARLDRRFDLLSRPGGDRPARQQTLRATIDWSYELLSEQARSVFRAVGVFEGGWSLPAAAVVCKQTDEVALLGELEALVDASLIEPAAVASADQRFGVLESLREYALEQLARCGEEQAAHGRHAGLVYQLAVEAAPDLTGPRLISCLDRLESERDNISSALRWLAATGEIERGLHIAALLWRFWHLRGHLQEGRALLATLLVAPAGYLPAAVRAEGLNALGSIAYWQRDNVFAQRCFDEALDLCRHAQAAPGIALSQYNLGFSAVASADYRSARRHFADALAGYEKLADQPGVSNALAGLALLDRVTGDYQLGQKRATRALAWQRQLGDTFATANTLSLLGSITNQLGHLAEAETMLREALILHDRAGNVSGITWMLHELAVTAAARSQPEHAVLLSSAAQSLEGRLGGGIPIHILSITSPVDGARDQLDLAQAHQAQREGQRMNRHEAITAALSGP